MNIEVVYRRCTFKETNQNKQTNKINKRKKNKQNKTIKQGEDKCKTDA